MWIAKSTAEKDIVGHRALALHPDALKHAVKQLVQVKGASNHLKIRAGEHLAAILLTAVCGPPTQIDRSGGVDLVFERGQTPEHFTWHFGDHDRADFEVKSFAGDFRRAESRMQPGDSHRVVVQTVFDVLTDATTTLERAVRSLLDKSAQLTSKNVFLIVHPFEAVAAEAYDDLVFIGHVLPKLSPTVDLDSLWILWHPDKLAMWSRDDQRWTDVLFALPHNPPYTSPEKDSDTPLQDAEAAFLSAINYKSNSPWQFGFSAADSTQTD
jgi:hypothetical protein